MPYIPLRDRPAQVSPFACALRKRLEDLALRQEEEVDDEAKRATLALRLRLYALSVTKDMDDDEDINILTCKFTNFWNQTKTYAYLEVGFEKY